MKNVRRLLSVLVVGLLTLGYLASQFASLNREASDYARRVDIPQVKFLALGVLIIAIVCAVIPDREVEPE